MLDVVERKMATIRRIGAITPIPDADAIETAHVDGWTVVVKKDQFKENDLVVFCEIDSWIPYELAPFLCKDRKEPREYNGVKGEKLRTVRLRKQLSQGLVLSLKDVDKYFFDEVGHYIEPEEEDDVTYFLGIQKYEPPVNAQLAGLVRGNFPSFLRKTDQERVQNLSRTIENWKKSPIELWEVTEKLDGSSMTVYYKDGDFGVCSRNLDLKESDDNSFWKIAKSLNLKERMEKLGKNIALQGELVGNIQGNWYKLNELRFYLFDVWDINEQQYLPPEDRYSLADFLKINHVPVIDKIEINSFVDVHEFLSFAEGKSKIANVHREGVVFKREDGQESFKCISNQYLLKQT